MRREVPVAVVVKLLLANMTVQILSSLLVLSLFFWEYLSTNVAISLLSILIFFLLMSFWSGVQKIQLLWSGILTDLEVTDTRRGNAGDPMQTVYYHDFQFQTKEGELVKESGTSEMFKIQGKEAQALYLPEKPTVFASLAVFDELGVTLEEGEIVYRTDFIIASFMFGSSNALIYLGLALPCVVVALLFRVLLI